MADFFISYNSADEAKAEEIAFALKEAGYKVKFAGWEVTPGTKISTWMRKATNVCDRMIAICSPDYFKSDAKYSGWERDSYAWFDVDGSQASVIPVIIATCTLDKLMADRASIDLRQKPTSHLLSELQKLKTATGEAGSTEARPQSTIPKPLLINVPAGRPVIGREDDIAKLRDNLAAGDGVALTNSGAIVAGQGGIGKTTLARAYAAEHGPRYTGVIWIDAAERQKIIDGLTALCGHLGLDRPEAPQVTDAQNLFNALTKTGEDWLFVYDNVETRAEIDGLIPPHQHLIVTTRQGEGWAGFTTQMTDILAYDSLDSPAVDLLLAEACRTDDRAGARDLAAVLGGLPLALVIAGGLIGKEGLGFAEYLTQVERIIARAPKNDDYPESVIGAVRLSYEKLSDDAKLVADLFAWWAPEGLQARLITDAHDGAQWEAVKNEVSAPLQELARVPNRVEAAIEALEERSLLRRDGQSFALHRMSAAALRALQGDAPQNASAAALLAAVYPYDSDHSPNWPDCRRLTPHVRALWASGAAPEIAAMDYLLNQAGVFLNQIGDDLGLVQFMRASLALKEKRLDESHRAIAVGFANLGAVLQRVGEMAEAEAALRHSLDLRKKHHQANQEFISNGHYALGFFLAAKGQAEDRTALLEGLREFQCSAAIGRQTASRLSVARANVLNALGTVRDDLGQKQAALRLYSYALAIQRQILPQGDERLGYGLNNVGAMALELGVADRAEPLLEEALALRQAVYLEAPQHENIVNTAKWLTRCYLTRARVGEEPETREAKAQALCAEFGFDFDKEIETAKQYPYIPKTD